MTRRTALTHAPTKWEEAKHTLRLYRRCTAHMQLMMKHMETYSEHASYMLLQQTELALTEHTASVAYLAMNNLHMTKIQTMRQTLFFEQKHIREEWDPTLWEISLYPLPKRLKAY